MLKKTMMLAMAAAIVAAFAVPATASASLWKHHGVNLETDKTLLLKGTAKFSGGLGSIECQTTSGLLITAGTSTGHIEQFHPDTTTKTVTEVCKAGGFLAACQVHAAQATELQWLVHNETKQIEITSKTIDLDMTGGFCPAKTGKVTPVNAANGHTVTGTPNQPKTVSSFTLSGQVLVDLFNSHEASAQPFRSETATVSGTQTIQAPNAATYSTE